MENSCCHKLGSADSRSIQHFTSLLIDGMKLVSYRNRIQCHSMRLILLKKLKPFKRRSYS